MTLIGMLHHRKEPTTVKKAYACAAVAKMESVGFFYFTYSAVNFKEEKINGWIYQNGSWRKCVVNFPDVIINISSPKKESQSRICKQLKKKCLFTSYPVGDKMKVYKRIVTGKKYASYAIPTLRIRKGYDVFSYFEKHSKLVLKPLSGNHGKGILFIDRNENMDFTVKIGSDHLILNKEKLTSYIDSLIVHEDYLIQPYIECKTKAGLAYDFRLHVQKNGLGNWEVNLIYPRISGNKKMVSNISNGGYRGELDSFLKEEFGNNCQPIKKRLEDFAVSFSNHFESLYAHDFDELGIDVGMDVKGKFWIFEVNWRPGSKHREFEVAKRMIPYSIYLAKTKIKPAQLS